MNMNERSLGWDGTVSARSVRLLSDTSADRNAAASRRTKLLAARNSCARPGERSVHRTSEQYAISDSGAPAFTRAVLLPTWQTTTSRSAWPLSVRLTPPPPPPIPVPIAARLVAPGSSQGCSMQEQPPHVGAVHPSRPILFTCSIHPIPPSPSGRHIASKFSTSPIP
ncbi:hypothetical protein C8J57DRAFT_143036 [Mycena rebaudengoi]|nr:hypothetical protein C8J57DRAFT_143036 [Mycena rebaudengoi]